MPPVTLPSSADSGGRVGAPRPGAPKNCEPDAPGGAGPGLAMATTPFLYFRFAGGASTIVSPGPPVPSPAGSPPWMTKSLTMRWKLRPSKNFWSARYLNEPPVFGARLASSVIWKSPHDVDTAATYVFAGSSAFVGLASLPTSWGGGELTLAQLGCAGGGSAPLELALSSPEPPQPAASRHRPASMTVTGRTMADNDNGSPRAAYALRRPLRPRPA